MTDEELRNWLKLKIMALRGKRNVPDFASDSGISTGLVSKLENGSNTTIETLNRILSANSITLPRFFADLGTREDRLGIAEDQEIRDLFEACLIATANDPVMREILRRSLKGFVPADKGASRKRVHPSAGRKNRKG